MDARLQALVVLLDRLIQDEKGTAALEYILLVALIAIAMMAGAQAFGGALQSMYAGFAAAFG